MPKLDRIQPAGQYKVRAPLSPAVKAGNLLFISGIPAYDETGKLAVGDFPAQMTQVMKTITGILTEAGADWSHVAKVNVLLTRREDFEEMNRIYAAHFPDGNRDRLLPATPELPARNRGRRRPRLSGWAPLGRGSLRATTAAPYAAIALTHGTAPPRSAPASVRPHYTRCPSGSARLSGSIEPRRAGAVSFGSDVCLGGDARRWPVADSRTGAQGRR
jgi:2-iminobutanoate/2-iminopropanoate deaminase